MSVIKIGNVVSIREPENFSITPDDRQELVKCLNGVFATDAGNYIEGDIFSFTAIFSPTSFATLKTYWQSRLRIDVIDQNGVALTQMRVIIKKYEYVKKHNFWQVNIELWRV